MLITRRLRRHTAPLEQPEITLTVTEDELLALAKFLDARIPKPDTFWWSKIPAPLRTVYLTITRAGDDIIHADRANRRNRSL